MSSGLSVAIVNFNTRGLLQSCIESVQGQGASVLVFDNASSDGSVEMVRTQFPWVELYVSGRNIGFGAAANELIRRSTSQAVLLLNSDTIVESGAIQSLCRYLDEHPRAAIIGPRLANPNGTLQPSCFPYPGTFRWLLDNDVMSRLARFFPILRERSYRAWSHKRVRIVPWVKGAALVIRKSAFEEIGGFDESFFMFHEETDLCRRCTLAGWDVCFVPGATVVHVGSASTDQCRAEMAFQLFSSTLQFHSKHYGPIRCGFLKLLWGSIVLGRYIRAYARLLMSSGSDQDRLKADLSGSRMILRRTPWLEPSKQQRRAE
jgi:N-acetylglucosaminyl-diphospho-decaprenol L-rhamnosyltransferase